MTTFYEQFMGLAPEQRARVAQEAGMSMQYIIKRTYTQQHAPVFRFDNAVAMDKASGGKLPFIQHTSGEQIDWDYVRRSIASAQRKGTI